jgi:phosphatidylserine/phosphatidylglycerophosphate/cardiolipin synthase-like enzyme
MKQLLFVLYLLVAASASTAFAWQANATGVMDVYFSPRGGATEAIVREIGEARKEVLVQAYSFTSVSIARALLEAEKRGVMVEAVLDKSQRNERYTAATFLYNSGIPVRIDDKHAIAHNKIIIIDRQTIITGSFNFTKAAEEKNAENLLIIKGNRELARKYLENYYTHLSHSEPYSH